MEGQETPHAVVRVLGRSLGGWGSQFTGVVTAGDCNSPMEAKLASMISIPLCRTGLAMGTLHTHLYVVQHDPSQTQVHVTILRLCGHTSFPLRLGDRDLRMPENRGSALLTPRFNSATTPGPQPRRCEYQYRHTILSDLSK